MNRPITGQSDLKHLRGQSVGTGSCLARFGPAEWLGVYAEICSNFIMTQRLFPGTLASG